MKQSRWRAKWQRNVRLFECVKTFVTWRLFGNVHVIPKVHFLLTKAFSWKKKTGIWTGKLVKSWWGVFCTNTVCRTGLVISVQFNVTCALLNGLQNKLMPDSLRQMTSNVKTMKFLTRTCKLSYWFWSTKSVVPETTKQLGNDSFWNE